MSQAIPSPINCGSECEPETQQIPGPPGADGTNGTDGSDGVNAFTSTSAQFTMPAEGANVNVSVGQSSFPSIGQILFIQYAGYLQVVTIPDATTIQLQNLKSTGSSLYLGNAAPGTIIPSGSTVSPAGLQGPQGTPATGALLIANNLSDVANTATSRTSLGLGTMATATATDYLAKAGNLASLASVPISQQNLDLEPGVDVQVQNDALDAISSLDPATVNTIPKFTAATTAAAIPITSVGEDLIGASSESAARGVLEVLPRYGLLASVEGVNLNALGDTAIATSAARYRIDKVTMESASTSLTTATAGLFTAAGGAGTTIAADQALSALTASTKFKDLTLQAVAGTDTFTASTLYMKVGVVQGGAATANLWVFGWAYNF